MGLVNLKFNPFKCIVRSYQLLEPSSVFNLKIWRFLNFFFEFFLKNIVLRRERTVISRKSDPKLISFAKL